MIVEAETRRGRGSRLAPDGSRRRSLRDRAGLGGLAVYAVFAGSIVLSAGTALHIQIASYTSIPFWDAWDELSAVQAAVAGRLRLYDLWVQHNEHRIFVPRLQFVADYTLFGGRLVFLLAMLFASLVALALVLALPAASVWRDRRVALGFVAITFASVLSPIGLENIAWPFQVSFVQVELFAAIAIAAAVYGRGAVSVATIVVAGIAATYSLASGLVAWPIVIAVMLCLARPRRSVVVVAVAGVLSAVSYLWHYQPVAGHSSYTRSAEHPLALAHYVVVYLGHPAAALGARAVDAVGVAGVVLLALLVPLAVRDRRLMQARPTLFGTALALFVFLTAIQTAVGRLSFGIEQALASRYSLPASVFWTGLIVGWAPQVKRSFSVTLRRGRSRLDVTGIAYVSVCLAAWLALDLVATPSADALHQIQTRGDAMLAAYVSGVEDAQASTADYPTPNAVLDRISWLRAEKRGPWDDGIGARLEGAQRLVANPSRLTACAGAVDSTSPVTGGSRYDGWIVPPPGARASHELDVVSRPGVSLGVGIVDVPRPDVVAAGKTSSEYSGFVAYSRAATRPAALVLLDPKSGRPVCRLPIAAR